MTTFRKNTQTKVAFAVSQLIAAPVMAATITVNDFSDTTADDMNCTLREAIISATGNGSATNGCIAGDGNDVIEFNSSSPETITLNSPISINDPVDDNELLINGPGTDQLTINAGENGAAFSAVRAIVNLNSLSITGGTGSDGGGFAANRSTITFNSVRVHNNTAQFSGGGIFGGQESTITLINSEVTNNTSNGTGNNGGGGINIINGSHLELINTSINNNAANQRGGGIIVFRSTATIAEGSEVNSNQISGTNGLGGGIFMYSFASDDEIGLTTITNSTVSNNSSTGDGGGVRSVRSYLDLNSSTVSGNIADGSGGAMLVSDVAKMNIVNSTISGNTTITGSTAGIRSNASTMTIANSTITANSAATNVGGVFIDGNSTVTLANTIIAGNMGATGNGREIYANNGNGSYTPTFLTPSRNLLGNSNYNELMAFGVVSAPNPLGNLLGTSDRLAIPTSSIFSGLEDNGGPTLTHALTTNSRALSRGNCSASGTNLDQDQRGEARGASCDLGAFELDDSNCFVVPTGDGATVVFCL